MKTTVFVNGKDVQMEEQFAKNLVGKQPDKYSFEQPKPEEVKAEQSEGSEDNLQREELFNKHKEKFGNFPPKNIKTETLIEKLKDE